MAEPNSVREEFKIGFVRQVLFGVPVAAVIMAASVQLPGLLPGAVEFGWDPLAHYALVWFFVSPLVLLLVRAVLHVLAFRLLAKTPLGGLRFGLWLVRCVRPVSVVKYRLAKVFPLVVLGPAGVLATVLLPSFWMGVVLGYAVFVCQYDVWLAARSLGVAKGLSVRDLPAGLGYEVLSGQVELGGQP